MVIYRHSLRWEESWATAIYNSFFGEHTRSSKMETLNPPAASSYQTPLLGVSDILSILTF